MANIIYNKFKYLLSNQEIDWVDDTIKVILTSGYTANIDNHNYYTDVSAYEVTGTGYSATGQELTNKSIVRDDVNDRSIMSASNSVWSNITVTTNGAILYKNTGTLSASSLIEYIDFGFYKSPDNTQFTISYNDTEGLIYIS